MTEQKFRIDEKHQSLLVALHSRAVDGAQPEPILGDRSAAAVVARIDYDFAALKTPPSDTIGIAIRSRELDRWTSEFIAAHPDAVVLHLGCGLDGRVHRVDPPPTVHWVDLDHPEVVDLVREFYPARPGLHLVGASVTDEAWLADVPAGRPVIVVAEGLSMYLTDEGMRRLVDRVVERFPSGEFAFNAFNPATVRLLKLHPTFRKTGATLTWGVDDPADLLAWNPKLSLVDEWFTIASPEVARMSKSAARTSRAMLRFRTLRRADRLLRYRFA